MTIEIKRRDGESVSAFLYRFNKKAQQSGLIKEVRARQFRTRAENKRKRRLGALYRREKVQEFARLKKYGHNK